MPLASRSLCAAFVAVLLFSLMACKQQASTNESANAARATAREAYIYGYPLVLMDVTRAKFTNVSHPTDSGSAPTNQFGNIKAFPDATFTDVVSLRSRTGFQPIPG